MLNHVGFFHDCTLGVVVYDYPQYNAMQRSLPQEAIQLSFLLKLKKIKATDLIHGRIRLNSPKSQAVFSSS